MKMYLVAAAILAIALPPTHANTMVLNNGSAALIAQTDNEGVFRTEGPTRLFDETKADITGAVADSPASDNSPDQTLDGPLADQEHLLCLAVAIIALCPEEPSQAIAICSHGTVARKIETTAP